MNLFENPKYYSRDEFDKISYQDQKELFLRIRAWVPNVDNETRYNKDKYKKVIIKKIAQICAYACSGNIPSFLFIPCISSGIFNKYPSFTVPPSL